MIVYPDGYNKSRPLSPDFATLLTHLWRGGTYGYFWQASLLRYSEEEAKAIGKKNVRKGTNKVTFTSWVDLRQPLPSLLPPQSFRTRYHNLSTRLLKGRFITPDDSSFLHLYFGVNPVCPLPSHLKKFKYGVRGQKGTVEVVNVFIGDLDVKDFGGDWQALWHYVDNLPVKPTAIIHTGGGLHLYFVLNKPFYVFENGSQSKARLNQIDGLYKRWNDVNKMFDEGAKDLTRVFRVDESINGKEKYAPDFPRSRFELLDLSRLYSLGDIEAVLPTTIVVSQVAKRTKSKSTKPKAAKPKAASQPSSWQVPTLEYVPDSAYTSQRAKIEFHLQYIDPNPWGSWNKVALALSGEPDGYEIWVEWSRQSPKFDEAEHQATWEEIKESRKKRIEKGGEVAGIGTIIGMARRRGAPTKRCVGEWQPVHTPTERVYLGGVRVGVADALADLFVPDGQSWALLNPPGADSVLSSPKHKPLKGAILDHIGGGSRRAPFDDGKRRQTKTCMVVMPSEMTRVLAFAARDAAHALDVQNRLASLGLNSLSYPLYAQFSLLPNSNNQGVSNNGQIPISYIYKADAFSRDKELGKMGISGLLDTYPLNEEVIEHIVLVAFSKPVPSQLATTITNHTQLDPYTLPYQLPSTYPPFCPSETLNISLMTEQGKELVQIGQADDGFRAWDDLLKRDFLNDPRALIGLQVGRIEIQPVRGQTNRITDSLQSVTTWHNRRHVMLALQDCGCGKSLMTWDSGDGYQVGWCASCGGKPVTNFSQTAHALSITPDELATQITVEHQLGQAGGYVIEQQPETAAVDMGSLIAEQEERVTDIRRQMREDINRRVVEGTGKGRIAIIGATAGLGKSTITRELIPSWYRRHGLLTRVTTDTKKLSYEWHEGLKGYILISSFVFESMLDCCGCYSYEVKQEALTAGYKLKHNKDCAFVEQIEEMLRGEDRKQKKVAILRHEHLRLRIGDQRLVAGADVYVSDEDLTKALIESDSIDLYIVQATLSKMIEKGCNSAETGIVAALFEVCRGRRVGMYQHVDGGDLVSAIEEHLQGQGLTLSFCLEAIKNTPFAREPRLEPENVKSEGLNLPKIWLPKFLKALEQTLKNSIHPSFFLVQTSKDKRYSRLEIESWEKHKYLPEYNRPLDISDTSHIFLDATPNELIYKALLPEWEGKIDFLSYTCPPSPQHQIIQIDGLNLTRKHLKDKEGLRVTASKLAAILNDLGLFLEGAVTRKDIKEPFSRHLGLDNDMVLNYRNQRGSNKLKEAQTVMLLADGTIPTNAALRFAHALWSHDPRPFERFDDGSYFAKSGARWVAKDERLQAVLDRVRAEGNQGSQRIRLINTDGMKVLIIVSTYDATELIDGLRPEQVTRIDAGRLHGNSRQVREAFDIYHDRLIESGRVPNTGPTIPEAPTVTPVDEVSDFEEPPMPPPPPFEADDDFTYQPMSDNPYGW